MKDSIQDLSVVPQAVDEDFLLVLKREPVVRLDVFRVDIPELGVTFLTSVKVELH